MENYQNWQQQCICKVRIDDDHANSHYLVLTTNKLKPYGNSNVGVQLSAIIKDTRSSYPELVVESVVSEKSYAVVRQSDICSAGPIYRYNTWMVISVDDQCHAQMEFQKFFSTVFKEAYSCQAADPHLQSMLRKSGYSVCPGIPEYPSLGSLLGHLWTLESLFLALPSYTFSRSRTT